MRRSTRARRPNDKVVPKYFALKGGLNLVDAPITMPNGMVLAAVNYELLSREGYRRIDGFERFDGQASPSDANYYILDYDYLDSNVSEGDIVTGVTSGASGELLIANVEEVPSLNNFSFPEALDNAYWEKFQCTVNADAAAGPDAMLAEGIVVDNLLTAGLVLKNNGPTVVVETDYATSVYVKAGNSTNCLLTAESWTAGFAARVFHAEITVNLTAGTIFSETNVESSYIEALDNDWYRIGIVWNVPAGTDLTNTRHLGAAPLTAAWAHVTGDGVTEEIYMVGAMTEPASAINKYSNQATNNHGYLVLGAVDGTFVDNEVLAFAAAADEFTFEFSSEYA